MTEFNENISESFGFNDTLLQLSPTDLWQKQTLEKIYCNLSNYPIDYWKGDIGRVIIPISFKETPYGPFIFNEEDTEDIEIEFIVISNTEEYFLLVENLPVPIPLGCQINITKDNIKQKTFQYEYKKETDMNNVIRVLYSNENDEYRTDMAEEENVKNIENTEEKRVLEYEMFGIKRKPQADRMAKFLIDYEEYVRWKCSFETDILGMLVCLGKIVGVTRYTELGWVAKLFRVILQEEQDFLEYKLSLIEYVPGVYHDYTDTNAYTDNYVYVPTDKYSYPGVIDNLFLFESRQSNEVYVCYSKPIVDFKFFAGALIYYKESTETTWKFLDTSYTPTAFVTLSSSISLTEQTIYFNPTSLYGTFELTGSFFSDKEEIHYESIDNINNCFLNCTRQYNDSTPQTHLTGDLCTNKKINIFTFDFTEKDVGKTFNFKLISVSSYGVMSTTGPELSITIYGYYLLPYPVGLLKLKIN